MRFFSTTLFAVAAVVASTLSKTVQPPKFQHLLTGTIITSPSETQSFIKSPYGHRLTAAGYLGGNWTTPQGKLVAQVYPNVGGDSGISDNNGVLHVDTRQTWKFVDDNSYGFMHAVGFGVAYVSDDLYIEFETDSPSHQYLNDKYLIGHGDFAGPIWTIYLFGLANSTVTASV